MNEKYKNEKSTIVEYLSRISCKRHCDMEFNNHFTYMINIALKMNEVDTSEEYTWGDMANDGILFSSKYRTYYCCNRKLLEYYYSCEDKADITIKFVIYNLRTKEPFPEEEVLAVIRKQKEDFLKQIGWLKDNGKEN